MYVMYHLKSMFDELVKVTDIVGTLKEVEEWYNTKRDKDTHYYCFEIPIENQESFLARINSKDDYEEE